MKMRVLVAVEDRALRARLSHVLQTWGHAVVLGGTDRRQPPEAFQPTAAIVAPVSCEPGRLALARKLWAAGYRVIVLAGSRADIAELARRLPDAEAFLPPPLDEQRLAGLLAEIAENDDTERGAPGPAAMLRFAGCTLDLAGRTFTDETGLEVTLTRAELDLLAHLARCSGRVQSRDQLRNAISGRDRYSNDRSIDMLVTRLRRKIDTGDGRPRLIVTVTGSGYKLGAPVERAGSASPRPAASPPRDAGAVPRPDSLRQLAVLACGIGGLAALSARLGPEDEAELTRAVHRTCAEVARRFRGVLARTLGDSAVIYFGTEQAQEHDPERAVRAGLELIEAMRGMAAPGALDAQVGIAAGEMMVAASPDASGGIDAIGQPLNLALRLRSLAAPGSVLVTGPTRDLVGGFFDYREMAPLMLARDVARVPVWQVAGESACGGRFEALHRAGMRELVGRRPEMDLLQHCWSRALAGAGQVVLVTGEAGIGKSRLIAEFQEESNVRLYGSLRYFGSQLQTDAALQPVIGELQRAAGFERSDGPAERRAKLEAVLEAPCRGRPEDVALVADLLSLPAPDAPGLQHLSPQARRKRTLEVLLARIRSLAARQPVLLVVEDAHWLDPTTVEYLSALAEALARLPVMLLVTARSGLAPPWPVFTPMTCITLARLSPEDAGLLVERVAGGKALPREVARRILTQTDGVPLFIEELTKALLEDGFLREGRHGWETIRPYPAHTVPKTLLGLLAARLDRLGPAAKEIAQIGAVIGRELSHELLAAVSTGPEGALDDALADLVASELVLRSGTGADAVYVFKHALVQDAAYASLLREHRRALHARIAVALEQRFPGMAETRPEVLAHHSTEAGLTEKAADLWGRAGLQSLQRSALLEATVQLGRALAQIATLESTARLRRQRIAFQVALANALMHTRGYASPDTRASFEEARRCIEEAEALGEPPDDPLLLFAVIYGFWVGNFVAFDGPVLRRLAEQFLALAERQGETVPLMIGHRLMGTSLKCTGNVVESRAHYDRALALYDPARHRSLATRFGQDIGVVLHSYRAWSLWLLGFPEAAHADSERALAAAREIGQAATSMYTLAHAARICVWMGDWATAATLGEEILALAEDKGATAWRAFGMMHRGSVLALTGRGGDAIALLAAGIDAWRSTGSTLWLPCYLSNLARAQAGLGRLDEARRSIGEAAAGVEATGARWCEAEVHRIRGEIALWSGGQDAAEAEASLERALAIARAQQARSWELRAATSLARLRREQGRGCEARALLAPVYGRFTEGLDTADLREAAVLLDGLGA